MCVASRSVFSSVMARMARASSIAVLAMTTAFVIPSASAQTVQITVRIERIVALDPADYGGPADFFARLTIDGVQYQTPIIWENNDISPNWEYPHLVSGAGVRRIGIEVLDKDFSYDDLIDVSPVVGKRTLDLIINTSALPCRVTGDVAGRCDSSLTTEGAELGRASLRFSINAKVIDEEIKQSQAEAREEITGAYRTTRRAARTRRPARPPAATQLINGGQP